MYFNILSGNSSFSEQLFWPQGHLVYWYSYCLFSLSSSFFYGSLWKNFLRLVLPLRLFVMEMVFRKIEYLMKADANFNSENWRMGTLDYRQRLLRKEPNFHFRAISLWLGIYDGILGMVSIRSKEDRVTATVLKNLWLDLLDLVAFSGFFMFDFYWFQRGKPA